MARVGADPFGIDRAALGLPLTKPFSGDRRPVAQQVGHCQVDVRRQADAVCAGRAGDADVADFQARETLPLRAAGADLTATMDFPDHHRFTPAELDRVVARAAALGAEPVTTPKDAVRLPAAMRPRIRVVGVRLAWTDEPALERLLRRIVP